MNCITSQGLRKLADEADRCGASYYSKAYRLLANRLDELGASGQLGKCQPEDLWPVAGAEDQLNEG
jgi:hypothetical protein